jgi:hypothetical protein
MEQGEVKDWYEENKNEIWSRLVIDTNNQFTKGYNVLYKKYIKWCNDSNKMYCDKPSWFVTLSRLMIGKSRGDK